jgi:thiosulfate dehydrogenase (quinone) large subunit
LTHADPGREGAAEPARTSRPSRAALSTLGLLPLRLFLGVTYLYAGVDKLANAHFLASGDAFSVAAQMAGYARTSPLAPLINASMPLAVPIGLLIALAELAVGLGLLTGLAFRLAAVAGAGLSLLFWSTASWSTAPYFFSPDLPYGFAFLTLALVGDGGLFVWRPFARRGAKAADARAGQAGATSQMLDRRSLLQVGLLGVLTLLAAAIATPLRLLGYGERGTGGQTGGATATPDPATPAPTAADPTGAASADATAVPSTAPVPSAIPATPTAPAPTGPVIGSLADFASGNSLPFTVPNQVPFAMGPGGPGIMVKLGDGSVVAYSAICTHGRCTVGFDQAATVIACPCHLATYDPAKSAAVLTGPAPLPLPEIPIAIDEGGRIHVTATA